MKDRPPIGFIVEGHGEYNCYPSLFCRIVDARGIHVPRVNAGGCGSIVKRIDEQLTDLFLASNPLNVIVTVDLHDVLEKGLANDCVELVHKLNRKIKEWRIAAKSDYRLHPLPNKIVCIVQIRKFESWIIADIDGLKYANLLKSGIDIIKDSETITNPCKWLKDNLLIDGCVKSPNVAKKLISALNPKRMRMHNRSFDKFYRDTMAFYKKWLQYISQK